MRKKLGICCLLAGIGCLLASVVFFIYNRAEDARAAGTSERLLLDVQERIIEPPDEDSRDNVPHDKDTVREETSVTENAVTDVLRGMPTTQVSGYDCIGVLSIPVLKLELPVLTDWSYEKLKIAPCIYYGTYYETDFVIAAHNYQSHFGRLSQLRPKDLILFTDISGTIHCYKVDLLETLPGHATEEMITSGFDLSLYTCTLGGSSRVTVRCSSVEK